MQKSELEKKEIRAKLLKDSFVSNIIHKIYIIQYILKVVKSRDS